MPSRWRTTPSGLTSNTRCRSSRGARCALVDGQGNFDQTLYFGSAFTIIRKPKDELKTGTFHAMCSQLGIKASDL